MGLRWDEQGGFGGAWMGYDGDFAVAQVVEYDAPPGWAAFIRGNRVMGGPWSSADEAKAAVGRAWGGPPPPEEWTAEERAKLRAVAMGTEDDEILDALDPECDDVP